MLSASSVYDMRGKYGAGWEYWGWSGAIFFSKGSIIINNYNIMKANNNEAGQPLNNNE